MITRASRALLLTRREFLALVLAFAASLPAVTPRLYSSDEVQYFAYLRSLWFDRDLSFENEYRYFYDHAVAQTPDFHETFLERRTPAGRRINFGTIGSAILWAPFYGAADVSTRLLRSAGSGLAADGYSRLYVAAVAYGSAFYAFAAILLGIRAARLLVGGGALRGGVAVWLGTPLLFYMYVAPPFSHACSAFAIALFVTVWLHVRTAWSPAGAAALGLSGALVAMVREQDLFFLLGPAVDVALTAVRQRGAALTRSAVSAAAGCAAFAVGFLPQLLAYQAINGHPSPSRYVTRKMFWHSPHALKVLVDPAHGFFIWTPLAALAVAGLIALAISRRLPAADAGGRRVAWCLLLMVALQVYVSGAVDSWSVAGAFGQRRFVALSALLIIGLAALWRLADSSGSLAPAPDSRPRRRTWRWVLTVAVVLCVYWNLALMALFGTRMMDRQRLEPGRNAYDAFVTLPLRAPDLLWRYLTDRNSFYQAPAAEGER